MSNWKVFGRSSPEIFDVLPQHMGASGGALVEALRYTPEGREIDSRFCQWNFSLT
jgi:hypothetical protein